MSILDDARALWETVTTQVNEVVNQRGVVRFEDNIDSDIKTILTPMNTYFQNCKTTLNSLTWLGSLGIPISGIEGTLTAIENYEQALNSICASLKDYAISVITIDKKGGRSLGGIRDDGGIPYDLYNNCYQFSTDYEEAYMLGDIFIADGEYSLTSFTNAILLKYNISDEETAKIIYNAVLEYGKKYYEENNNNPLKELSQDQVWENILPTLSNLMDTSIFNNYY